MKEQFSFPSLARNASEQLVCRRSPSPVPWAISSALKPLSQSWGFSCRAAARSYSSIAAGVPYSHSPGYGHVRHKPQLRGCSCIPSPGSSTGGTPRAPGQGPAVPQTSLVYPQCFWRTWPNTRAPVWTHCFSHSQESSSLASTSFTHRGTQKSNNESINTV